MVSPGLSSIVNLCLLAYNQEVEPAETLEEVSPPRPMLLSASSMRDQHLKVLDFYSIRVEEFDAIDNQKD